MRAAAHNTIQTNFSHLKKESYEKAIYKETIARGHHDGRWSYEPHGRQRRQVYRNDQGGSGDDL